MPQALLFANTLKNKHVCVHRHAHGKNQARDTGQGQGHAEIGHGTEDHEGVQGKANN